MKKAYAALAVVIVLLTVLSGCVTAKSSSPAGPLQDSLFVKLLSEKEVKDAYGWSLTDNPYLTHGGTLLPQVYDFLVFRLSVVNSAATEIELLRAGAVNADEKLKAPYYDAKRFTEISMSAVETPESSGSFSVRKNKITWNYIPTGTVTLKPGKHSYIFVLLGRHPLPDSLTAHIELLVNGEERDFDIPVPDAPA